MCVYQDLTPRWDEHSTHDDGDGHFSELESSEGITARDKRIH